MPTALPRSIATFEAFENAMSLDIAMGGSTNTVLHLLAAAQEGGVPLHDGRHRPAVAPGAEPVQGRALVADVHMEDVHRAGGIMAILGELDRAGLLHRDVPTVHAATMGEALDVGRQMRTAARGRYARVLSSPRRAACAPRSPSARISRYRSARSRPRERRDPRRGACLQQGRRAGGAATATSREDGCIVKTAGVDPRS